MALAVMVSELGAAVPRIRRVLPGWISAAVAERIGPPVVSTRRKAVALSTRAVKVEEPNCNVILPAEADWTEPEVSVSPFCGTQIRRAMRTGVRAAGWPGWPAIGV